MIEYETKAARDADLIEVQNSNTKMFATFDCIFAFTLALAVAPISLMLAVYTIFGIVRRKIARIK